MKTLDLIQGSPAWLAHRRTHFNASDAPAMMGYSPYKSRNQLLQEMHTGLTAEVDAGTQRRFDDGHRFEALARPLAEEIVGEDLYPCTGVEGKLSASFDGLTMSEEIAFEHKTLNDELRVAMSGPSIGGLLRPDAVLPLHYRVQMEQQMMVSGASEVLFMATRWEGETLAEQAYTWYRGDQSIRTAILQGWAQFAVDLEAFKPTAAVPVAVAAPVESLPAVSVHVNGELAIASNLPEFGTALRAFIERIPSKPSTDQEFADAEAACKALKKAEDALESAETHALAELSSVDEMRRLVADLRNLARSTRLAREKDVSTRKDQIRLDILSRGQGALGEHVVQLNERLGGHFMPPQSVDFAGAVKGKRTIVSLQGAVDDALATAKIAANALADRIQINLRTLEANTEHSALFPDRQQIVVKAKDDFDALLAARIAQHKEAIEAAAEKARERIRDEERLLAQQVATPPPTRPEPPPSRRISEDNRSNMPATGATPALTLGQIGTRLGFSLSADFIRTLGIEPAGRQRAAVLYHEHDFSRIAFRLVAHINAVLEEKTPA